MDIDKLQSYLSQALSSAIEWSTSPAFYAQAGLILIAVIAAYSLAHLARNHLPILREEPKPEITESSLFNLQYSAIVSKAKELIEKKIQAWVSNYF